MQIKTRNYRTKYLIIGLLSIVSCFSYSFADSTGSCSTCTSMPAKLGQLSSMTTEILAAIPTIGTASPYMGKPVSPTRFEKGYFDPPKTSIISKTLRRARESLGSIISLERIYIEGTLRNTIIGKTSGDKIVGKGTIFKRDRGKMEDIQQQINNKKFSLSVGGGRTSSVRGKIFEKIKNIISKYQKAGLLDTNSRIEAGVTYSEILKTLDDLNSIAKAQIADNETNYIEEQIARDGITIKIDKNAAQSIIDGYKCVSDQKCNSSLSQLKADLKSIGELAKNGATSAADEIKDATSRLTATLQNIAKPTNKSNTESESLKNRFGLKGSQIENAGILGFNSPRRRSQRQTVKDGFGNMFGPKDTSKEIAAPVQGGEMQVEFKMVMATTANDILDDAKAQQDTAMMSDNKDVLTWFGALSKQLAELNNLVGDKSKEGGLIRNLGEVCKNQCSNITSKSCYY